MIIQSEIRPPHIFYVLDGVFSCMYDFEIKKSPTSKLPLYLPNHFTIIPSAFNIA